MNKKIILSLFWSFLFSIQVSRVVAAPPDSKLEVFSQAVEDVSDVLEEKGKLRRRRSSGWCLGYVNDS